MTIQSGSQVGLAEELIDLRRLGKWLHMAARLEGHQSFAEDAVSTFRNASDDAWMRIIVRMRYMGLLPRGLSAEEKSEMVIRLRDELKRLDQAATVGPMPLDSADLLLLMVVHADNIMATATARNTIFRLSIPLDGEYSQYRIYYQPFDRGTKMDVYEPAGVLLASEGRYRVVKRTDLPDEVREAFFWYRNHVVVKAVRLEDSHARAMNEQVDEGYTVARYCLGPDPAFVHTTWFRHVNCSEDPAHPSGISLIIQEPAYAGAEESGFRPLYIGQEGMVVVVQRRAHGPNIYNALDAVRRSVEEAIKAKRSELEREDTLLRRLSTRGRTEIMRMREELQRIEETVGEEKQYVVGQVYKPFKDFLANTYGVADLDPDFERNYSLNLLPAIEGVSKRLRDTVSHVVSFDFDQFRTLKGFTRPENRLPDVFDTDENPSLAEGIRQAQLKALHRL